MASLVRAGAFLLVGSALSVGLVGCSDDSTGGDPVAVGECSYTPTGDAAKEVALPSGEVQKSGDVTVELDMGEPVTLALDTERTPCTTHSFVNLVKQGYFDGTQCHRLTAVPGLQVLQCGDPTGTGAGGPGYQFADEYPINESGSIIDYRRGVLAMANAGPGTNGSQFFIVYGDSQLPPAYTIFGEVSGGMERIDGIAEKGIDGGSGDGAPVEPVEFVTASLR